MQKNDLHLSIYGAVALAATLAWALLPAAGADAPAARTVQTDSTKPKEGIGPVPARSAQERTEPNQSIGLDVGMTAPDFTLSDQDGKSHHLADLRGKMVVLAFYPKDDTPGCTAEMCSLRDHLPKLQKDGAVVFGISVQDVGSKRAFADKFHLTFPILADADKKVTQTYGVLGSNGYAERVTFTIGPDGTITNIDRALRFDRKPGGVVASSHGDTLEIALTENWRAEVGKPAPSFTLKNYDGKPVVSTDTKSKLTVLMFLSIHCPVSNAYNDRMARLAQDYADKGVRFLGINANNGETPTQIATHAQGQHFSFAVLKDTRNVVADHFNVQHTPEVWVLDQRGVARYHGAIDNSQNVSSVKSHYLVDALDALLAGKEPPQTETKAIGCSISGCPSRQVDSAPRRPSCPLYRRPTRGNALRGIECERGRRASPSG